MRKRFLLSVTAVLGFIITLLGFQQKIFADSEYPHSDVQDNPLLCFIIGTFVIAIIVVSAYILLRIQHKNHMKMIESQETEKTEETKKTEETEETKQDE